MTLINEKATVPLIVLESDGTLRVVVIPLLSETGFEFLRNALDTYKPAIVRAHKAKHPPKDG